MANIVAALYKTMDDAERARAAVAAEGIPAADMSLFALNAPGQHAMYPVGGDEDADAGAKHAHVGAATGAAVGATAALALGTAAAVATGTGPIVAATAAAIGAYTGSLVGALNTLGDKEGEPHAHAAERPAGVMLAVATPSDAKDNVIRVLRSFAPLELEQAEGVVSDGVWIDFDPRRPPALL
jgi:hypothetical protein